MKCNDSQVEERIYRKTKELITSKGIKGWHMDHLAKESGMAKNTLYKIIGSKENLILEVVLNDLKQVEEEFKALLMLGDEKLITQKLSDLISRNIIDFIGGYLNEVLLEYPSLEDKVKANEDNIRNMIVTFIIMGQSQNQFKKEVDPRIFFESILGIILHQVRLGYSGDVLSDKIEKAFTYMLEGIKEKG